MRSLLFYFFFLFVITACDPAKIIPGSSITERESHVVSGTLTYDRVPITDNGLDYESTIQSPVRKVTVQAIDDETDRVVSYAITEDDGSFSLKVPVDVKSAYLRVLAEIKEYEVRVQDNTNGDALYAFEIEPIANEDSVSGFELNIPSGWTGSNAAGAYTDERYAAPFAILDTLLTTYEKFSEARPNLSFPALKVNWSKNNTDAITSLNYMSGEIGISHYQPQNGQLYIRGKSDVNTDEYDTHVLVHEWGHYFESKLGRSDNPGGNHGLGDYKDIALAFGEGWGDSLGALILEPDVSYRDSLGMNQRADGMLNISIENPGIINNPNPGWFSEITVAEILYDIYDSTNGGADTLSLGIGPIIDVMTEYQTNTRARTSIFSFISGLKTYYPAYATAINSLTSSKSISPVQDDFGTGETNNGGWAYNLPIYNNLVLDGAQGSVKFFGQPALLNDRIQGSYINDLVNNRFFKFTATSSTTRLVWTSDDTYLIEVLDGNNKLLELSEQATGTPLTAKAQNISTVPGETYTIRVYTIGSLVYTASTFNFEILLQAL